MATWEHELAEPPSEPRARELWLQHAAGFILFEDVRKYAIEEIDPALSAEARAAALKGIDAALYGLMLVIDGETGALANGTQTVTIDFTVRLTSSAGHESGDVPCEVDLREGDGMCMGYHGWLEGDFGVEPIVVPSEG